ncbi:MAG: beta-galactosidase [Planctomycetota bacterium]|jgi:beta-galactosidase|nr:beta-galactosidase [Planctomycetota bacterium]
MRLAITALILLSTCPLHAADQISIPGADFGPDAAEHWRGDWKLHRLSSEGELSFVAMQSSNTKGNTVLSTKIPVDPDWQRLRFTMRVRVHELTTGSEGWQNFRFNQRFTDAQGKHIGGYQGIAQVSEVGDWQEISAERDVPPDATQLDLSPGFYFATGRVDLDHVAITVLTTRPKPGDAVSSATLQTHWDQTPAVDLSVRRGEMVLNDCWQFSPAESDTPPSIGWGLIRVPGSWVSQGWPPVPATEQAPGSGPQWTGPLKDVSRMWYRREITPPATWDGRRFELDLELVSTDARVYIDGALCGEIHWPGGVIALDTLKPGVANRLDILVVAAAEEKQVANYMDGNDVTMSDAKLAAKGIIGNVIVRAVPQGERITSVFVQTSVQHGHLDLAIDTAEVSGPRRFAARMIDATGATARSFTGTTEVSNNQASIGWAWDDAHLWDIDDPHQYRLELDLLNTDGTVADTFVQRFGFREFHIKGKDFYLNNKRLRLRPVLGGLGGPLVPQQIDNAIDAILDQGFTFKEFWPGRSLERGSNSLEQQRVFAESASSKGLLISGIAPHLADLLRDNDCSDADRAQVRDRFAYTLRLLRNEPSVVMWANTGNFFPYTMDQDPRLIGRSDHGGYGAKPGQRHVLGAEMVASMAATDPTRPVFTHHGGSIGSVHTLNMYLCLIPIQERIEWLEAYYNEGNMPFMPVEFGTPLHTTWHRGRAGFASAITSEPLVSEFAARDLGRTAYAIERKELRATIRTKFSKDQVYGNMHGSINQEPALLAQIAEHSALTWRHWRTWGITGGMIPWANGHGWRTADGDKQIELRPYVVGQRGTYTSTLRQSKLFPFGLPGKERTIAGDALVANNTATLAWIAGRDGNDERDRRGFSDRSHHYSGGDTLSKQLVFINDTRHSQTVSYQWRVELAGAVIATGEDQLEIGSADDRLVAIDVPLPVTNARSDGTISLTATIGNAKHEDQFAFRVYPAATRPGTRLAVLDALGDTAAMLTKLGYTTETWDGTPSTLPLVIGRRQLSEHDVPAGLEAHLAAGGRAIIMAQDPEWMRHAWGLRVAHHQARRMFPVDTDHPISAGLDERDLWLWNGHSRLLDPRPNYNDTKGWAKTPAGQPYAGWRWGTRHSLSSAAIEKPHHTGWRPIFECEFDLAYSPLLELDHLGGKLMLCTLDLEDHSADPVAELLTHRIVTHLATAPIQQARTTVLLGSDDDAALLQSMGLQFTRSKDLPATGLAIIGDTNVNDAALRRFVNEGGHAVILARSTAQGLLGMHLQRKNSIGSLNDPSWPEAAGLSASDLRWRNREASWLLSKGAEGTELGADGLLARQVIGTGVAIHMQTDPRQLPADTQTYFRYTRWRQTRALAQILTNCGASFAGNAALLTQRDLDRVSLADHPWQARQTLIIEAAPRPQDGHADPGVTEAAQAAVAEAVGSPGWQNVTLPSAMEELGPSWAGKDGEAVFRCSIELNAEQAAQDHVLVLGKIDDFDTVFVNGTAVGSTNKSTKSWWAHPREYRVAASALKPGVNQIAIRVFDNFGGGGVTGGGRDFALLPAAKPESVGLYHADYREDFKLGDDPYRYYRW